MLRKELSALRDPEAADAPTHESLVRAKYGDAEPRQPRPQRQPGRQRDRRVALPGQNTATTAAA